MYLRYSEEEIDSRLRLLSVEYCCYKISEAIHDSDRTLSIIISIYYPDHIKTNCVIRDSNDNVVLWCPYCGAKILSEEVAAPKGTSFRGIGYSLIGPDWDAHPEYYEKEARKQRAKYLRVGRTAIYITGQYEPEKENTDHGNSENSTSAQ